MGDPIPDVSKHKVIIIGAGIAGLAAATHLSQHDMKDFIILEAQDRIGGRIYATEINGQQVELGANWIHGVLGNPMYELAMANGLVDITHRPKMPSIIASTTNGSRIPFSLLQETYGAYMCFLRRCEDYFTGAFDPPPGIYSVGEHVELEIAIYLDKVQNANTRKLQRLIFNCLLKRESCITGCNSMIDIDLIELGSYKELQGGNIALPGGYSSILDPICSKLSSDCIKTNCQVTKIKWPSGIDNAADSDDSDKTVIEVGGEDVTDETVYVYCKDKVYSADSIICTLPLGVLKSCDIFCPKLPKYKEKSIARLLYGVVNKIFLYYDRPFLSKDVDEILLLWDDDDGMGDWSEKIYSFSKVNDTLLLGWISGVEAETMEKLDDKTIGDKCTEILRTFLKDSCVPFPAKCLCTRWKADEFSRGSYTAIGVGSSQLDIEHIARPMHVNNNKTPVITFAGEHTHPNFYSTVHGAYLSGRAAAEMLLISQREDKPLECADLDLSSWIQGVALT
ncbi:spermine oxidase [Adelges cooleyi]|uniref:spermine oxidase n=1 Tax=Adelges cooleyi TaxID=133065 RepID=UPI0021803DF3|nr:spermine oxidase [Adelges cooleyi]